MDGLLSYVQDIANMDFIYLKLVLLINGWLLAQGAPVAMLQHATSSQSIVFHTGLSDVSTAVPSSSNRDNYATKPPKYEYKYEVSDQQTGDRKSHWESRDGDRVRGVYTVYEPDGALRTVEYTADSTHGFNAVVKRNEPNKHQFSNQESFSQNRPNFNPLSPKQKSDRGLYSSNSRVQNPDYGGGKNVYKSGVDFSVSHVLKKYKGNDDLY